jgi:lipoprotein NlpI
MHRHFSTAFAALILSTIPVGVHAAAYDDFARGVAAYERGEFALAIPALTAAIGAGDLAPNLKPTAYLDRARAYLGSGQCAHAMADLSDALSAGANAFDVDESRGFAAVCLRDYETADADYSAAIAIQPKAHIFFERGLSRWVAGNFADAASDFAKVATARPQDQYAMLWLALTRARSNAIDPAVMARDASALDLDAWPGPIVDFFLGHVTHDRLIAAAAQGADSRVIADQQCEANFYVAEWLLVHGSGAAAKPLLQTAAGTCPHDFIEWRGATVELARLP